MRAGRLLPFLAMYIVHYFENRSKLCSRCDDLENQFDDHTTFTPFREPESPPTFLGYALVLLYHIFFLLSTKKRSKPEGDFS